MTVPGASNGAAQFEPKASYEGQTLGAKMMPHSGSSSKIHTIDIRRDGVEINLQADILSSLKPESGPKSLPTLILYDERGLQLFEEVRPTLLAVLPGAYKDYRSRIWTNTTSQMLRLMCSQNLGGHTLWLHGS